MPHDRNPGLVSLSLKGSTSLVRCWSIALQASRGTFRFTEHDRSLIVDGETYYPSDAISASAAVNQGDLGVPNTSARGIISSGKLTEKMLREGTFNGADVEEFIVDWRFPFAGRTRYAKYQIGRVSWNDAMQMFEADLVGLSERLTNRVGEIYTRTCRWNLGDSNCTVDLGPWTRTATITSVIDDATFLTGTPAGGATEDGFFNDGPITWTNSNNVGLKSVAKRYTVATHRWELASPPPTPLLVGDTLTAIAGCNKLAGVDIDGGSVPGGHCKNKFNNLVNFGGFPFMPTNDKLYMTPFAKRNQ